MTELSARQIEKLMSLVEQKLGQMSGERRDQTHSYRVLQRCRHRLIAMAAARLDLARPKPKALDPGETTPRLRVIPGGKT